MKDSAILVQKIKPVFFFLPPGFERLKYIGRGVWIHVRRQGDLISVRYLTSNLPEF
jgi:hypothetical protein